MAKIYTFSLILISILISFNADAQKEDHRWIIGYNLKPQPDTLFGHTSFDFNYDPVKIYHDSIITTNFIDVNSSLSDPDGNLLACTNGQILMNGMGGYIEDTINYDHDLPFDCRDWEYSNYGNSHLPLPIGILGGPRAILLPMKNKNYAIYSSYDRCIEIVYKLSYSVFIINNEYPSGMMLLRDFPILLDSLSSSIQAVRHGNGRDWWLVTFSHDYNWLFTFQVDEQGIAFHSRVRTVVGPRPYSAGQISFSPDGSYLSFHLAADFTDTGHEFVVYDFDRCSGSIANPRSKILPNEPEALGFGIAFSYDSRFLYVSTGKFIRQYDMLAADMQGSEKIVAEYDGFVFEFPNFPLKYLVNFNYMKLAPDGRIYVIPSSGSQRYISVIHYPHSVANEVYVAQHSIYTPRVFSRTVPNMPDYRLGPLDGSPCDTLGLDNHPVAKFRYEADTLDHLRLRFTDLSYFRPEAWSWDFGDGSPASAERYPQHLYAKSGTYEVCLTVSNENSSDNNCRTVTIGGTNSTDETAPAVADVSLFPNPVSDFLLITLGEYIPAHGTVSIHDLTGKKLLSRRLYHGHNTLDMSHLPSGLYLCVLADGAQHIRTMKVVKE